MDYNSSSAKNMKKRPDRPLHINPTNTNTAISVSSSSSSSMAATTSSADQIMGKMKWEEGKSVLQSGFGHQQDGAGVDELLAVLGYNVRPSDMVEVAQKLEQLEMVMGNAQEEDTLLSHLSSETVHYNPSDLSTWLESMLSEINPPVPEFDSSSSIPFDSSTIDFPKSTHQQQQTQIYDEPSSSNYDLSAIPGEIVYGEREKKRIKQEHRHQQQHFVPSDSCSSSIGAAATARVLPSEPTRPVVLVDSQESGIRLVHTLLACADAIQQDNLTIAEALVKQIGILAVSQSGAMRKVATFFAEALARRIYKLNPIPSPDRSSFAEVLHLHFYRSCPYLQFAHFTSNQAILEAFAGKNKVHIIDFGIKQGTQWPQLIQTLALRPEGPPSIRLTGIGPPQSDNADPLQQIAWKLTRFAETLRVKFEFQGLVVNSLADLDSETLRLREGESVAVNSVFELHELLARPGSVEKVLGLVREVRPTIVTVAEQEANHNGPGFLDRFTEALHYYSTLFDSLESCGGGLDGQDLLMSELYLGSQIFNVVACEGEDRVERHETMAQWKTRFTSAGFSPVHLGSSGFKQASSLVSLFGGGDGYRVEENNGCLTLGWYTRPLIATSAWQLGSNKKP